MKNIFLFTFALATFALAVNSCGKHAEQPGKVTLNIRLKHHGVLIPNHKSYPDSVFIKFNTKDAPASLTDYDKIYVGLGTDEYFTLPKMNYGNLFIYATGLDSANSTPSSSAYFRVSGGQYVKINYSQRKSTVDVDIAVTE